MVRVERLLKQLVELSKPKLSAPIPLRRHLLIDSGYCYVTAGGGVVQRWSYTVPNGCSAVLDFAYISCYRYDDGGGGIAGNDYYSIVATMRNPSDTAPIFQKLFTSATLYDMAELLLPSPISLDEGDRLVAQTSAGFTGGAVLVLITAVVSEYQKSL